jgi:predicted nucleic acid-binding protein
MVGRHLGPAAERRLVRAAVAGEVLLDGPTTADLARAERVLEKYADADVGLVDASIVAVAERLKITTIATTDHRHFRLFRPRHCRAFTLVP